MDSYLRAFSTHFESMFCNMSDLAKVDSPVGRAFQIKTGLIEAMKFHNQAKE